MKNKPKFLVIIPARGGSKGIKNKNIVNVCSRPLVYYSVNPALELKKEGFFEDVIVSTDSQKIADICKKMGVDVPFLRPKDISRDKSRSIDFILHAINFFERKKVFFDFVILLQPTAPLRKKCDIKGAVKIFLKEKKDSLISVKPVKDIITSSIYVKKGKKIVPFSPKHNKGVRRQDDNPIFVRNGAIYITSVNYLKKNKKIISDNPVIFEMPEERSLNIDYPEDLNKLRKILCK
jgi:N-acylneuraminate cytidylyltransferase/CMP-N,N'-diacetyllegionaminic acid synthase